jgi:hypothetical protein
MQTYVSHVRYGLTSGELQLSPLRAKLYLSRRGDVKRQYNALWSSHPLVHGKLSIWVFDDTEQNWLRYTKVIGC